MLWKIILSQVYLCAWSLETLIWVLAIFSVRRARRFLLIQKSANSTTLVTVDSQPICGSVEIIYFSIWFTTDAIGRNKLTAATALVQTEVNYWLGSFRSLLLFLNYDVSYLVNAGPTATVTNTVIYSTSPTTSSPLLSSQKPYTCPEDGFFASDFDRCVQNFYTCLDGFPFSTVSRWHF